MEQLSFLEQSILGVLLVIFLTILFLFMLAKESLFSFQPSYFRFLKAKMPIYYKKTTFILKNDNLFFIIYNLIIQVLFICIIIIFNIFANILVRNLQINWYVEFCLKLLILTFFILIVLEIIPSLISNRKSIALLPFLISSTFKTFSIFYKFALFINKINNFIKTHSLSNTIIDNRKDLLKLLNKTHFKTQLEKKMLDGILAFQNKTVNNVMQVKLDIIGVDFNSSFDEVIQIILQYKYSRYPVYEKSLDNIVGLLYSKDILPFLNSKHFDWHNILQPIFFIHENKKISDLLIHFQEKNRHFAVVINEFGETEGIATLEDVLEQVVGEINDEFDEHKSENIGALINNIFIFDGKTQLYDVEEALKLPFTQFLTPESNVHTIAGFFIDLTQDIPKVNKKLKIPNAELTILEMDNYRIKKIKVTLD